MKEIAPPTRRCPQCGAESPGGILEGLCPKCVAALAFGNDASVLAASTATPTGPVNRRFGDFELLEEIARGGMGVVFKARQLSLNRTVAVKMILSGQLASAAQVQRFRTEAEAAGSLQHPNIVAIHEVGEHDGHQFFSMDYVEGQSLAELVREGPLPAARAARYVQTIAEAIHYAHEHGTLHRDLKPSSVLIDGSDQPRITDFGLARIAKADSDLTVTGQLIGTPGFMPPEQAAAGRGGIGPHSDVYSLGAILFFLLTSRPPFAAKSIEETLAQMLGQSAVFPVPFNRSVPRDLRTICLKALEKDARRRYATARELAEDLGRFRRGEPIRARPTNHFERTWRWCRRHPAVASLGLGLAATLTVLVVVVALNAREVQPERLTPMPVLSGNGASGVIDGKINQTSPHDGYPGLTNHFHAYDPQANLWSHALSPTPVPLWGRTAGVLNGKLYLVGGGADGGGMTGRLDVYDPVSNAWRTAAPMPTARGAITSAVLDGKLYVFGGTDGTNKLSTVEIYDPAIDHWVTGPPLPAPRVSAGAVAVNRILYVVGGVDVTREEKHLAPVLALQTDGTWSKRAAMPYPVIQASVAALNGIIYVAGGKTSFGATAALQAYEVATDQWKLLARMPEGRHSGAAAQVVEGKLYVIGGWSQEPPMLPHNEVFAYDPRRDVWRR